MKKSIIISIVGLVVVGGILLLVYSFSFHKVSFSFDASSMSIDVYRRGDDTQKITTLSQPGELSLRSGTYVYRAQGERVSDAEQVFTVPGEESIAVNPDYSNEHLRSLLVGELAALHNTIKQSYPALSANYTILEGELYKKGDWYGTLLVPNANAPAGTQDTYRAVLHKESGTWKIVRYPEIILLKKNYAPVPEDVLYSVNNLIEN